MQGLTRDLCVSNTLQHTATHCNALRQTATHYHTLQHTATHCSTRRHELCVCDARTSGLHAGRFLHSFHCNTLQHTATHCNTLQHTATHFSVFAMQGRRDYMEDDFSILFPPPPPHSDGVCMYLYMCKCMSACIYI